MDDKAQEWFSNHLAILLQDRSGTTLPLYFATKENEARHSATIIPIKKAISAILVTMKSAPQFWWCIRTRINTKADRSFHRWTYSQPELDKKNPRRLTFLLRPVAFRSDKESLHIIIVRENPKSGHMEECLQAVVVPEQQ